MKRFAYLDIEATHTNWHDAEIIEIAFIIKDENGKDLDFFESLIRPQKKVTEEITQLTGITQKMLDNAPEFYKVAAKVYEKLKNCIIVAHKAEFDFEILSQAFLPLQITLKNKKICTLNLSKRVIPELSSYSLASLCALMQIKLKHNHRALEDAIALYELHTYLRLINGENTYETHSNQNFLPDHKRLIKKAPQIPGVVLITENQKKEVIKTENLHLKLKELLEISPKNKSRITSQFDIKLIPCASLIEAALKKSQIEKEFFPFCIYTIKSKHGRLLLKMGKTNIKKKALYYTHSKNQAYKIIKDLQSHILIPKFAFRDCDTHPSEIIKKNLELMQEIKKLVCLEKNYLIRSLNTIDGLYSYVVIKGNSSYARFKSSKLISKSEELVHMKLKLKLKKIGPREYMTLNHSLKWIKNQRSKTDLIYEIKL